LKVNKGQVPGGDNRPGFRAAKKIQYDHY
jgi:hypothetical protein